jgi:hypothetical protein
MLLFHDQGPTILPSLKAPFCLTRGRWWRFRGIRYQSKDVDKMEKGNHDGNKSFSSEHERHYTLLMDLSGKYINSDEFEAWCGPNLLEESGMVRLGLWQLAQRLAIVTRRSSEVMEGSQIWLFQFGKVQAEVRTNCSMYIHLNHEIKWLCVEIWLYWNNNSQRV